MGLVPALKASLELRSLEKSKSCPKTTVSMTDFNKGALNFSLEEKTSHVSQMIPLMVQKSETKPPGIDETL